MSQSIKLKNNTYLDSSSITDDRKKLSDMLNGNAPMGNIVVDSIRGKNLFNINGDVNVRGNDATVHGTSNTVSENTLICNYNSANSQGFGQIITGLSGKEITFTAKCTSNGTGNGIYISIYENGSVQKSEGIQAGDTEYITYTPISNTTIFAFSTVSGAGAQVTNIQVELGDESTTYAPYDTYSNKELANQNVVVGSIRSKNMFNKDNVDIGYFYSNGTIGKNSDYRHSNYIPVNSSNKYTLSGINNPGSAHVIEYNANKEYVDFWGSRNQTITTTANTKYIRVSMNVADLNTYQVESGETATDYAPYQNLKGWPEQVSFNNGWMYATYVPSFGWNILVPIINPKRVQPILNLTSAEYYNGSWQSINLSTAAMRIDYYTETYAYITASTSDIPTDTSKNALVRLTGSLYVSN